MSAADRHKSASERLFPSRQAPSPETVDMTSKDRVRRISDLVSPRPFIASGSSRTSSIRPVSAIGILNYPQSFTQTPQSDEIPRPKSADFSRSSPTTVATVRPVQSSTSSYIPAPAPGGTTNTATVKPLASGDDIFATPDYTWGSPLRQNKNKQNNRLLSSGYRYRTISSSQPIKLERTNFRRDHVNTVAGDLITSVSFKMHQLMLHTKQHDFLFY